MLNYKYFFIFSLAQVINLAQLNGQSVVDPDLLIIGRDQLPENGESITDTFFFFDESKGAVRFGILNNLADWWSPNEVGGGSAAWGVDTKASGGSSTAWGESNVASSGLSTAWGLLTTASGVVSTAYGQASEASGSTSTAWGIRTEASGSKSTAWGENSIASGVTSTVWGEGSVASGFVATAWGSGTASGDATTAWGINTEASGRYATVWGNEAQANALESTAWGLGTRAMGNQSTATGTGTIANADNSFVIGAYNDTIVTVNPGSSANTDPLFILGNGSAAKPSNAFVIRKNGTVGIGTNGGDAKLDVRGLGASNEPHLLLVDENPTSATPRVFARFADTTSLNVNHYWEFNALARPDNNHALAKWNFFYRGTNKNILQLQGDGNVFLDGNIAVTSDRRLKSNIRSVSDRASDLLQLGGYTYNRKSSEASEIGLIAQEVEEYFPELVIENDEGYKTVNYDGLIPVLIEALKEEKANNQSNLQILSELLKNQNDEVVELKKRLLKLELHNNNH